MSPSFFKLPSLNPSRFDELGEGGQVSAACPKKVLGVFECGYSEGGDYIRERRYEA